MVYWKCHGLCTCFFKNYCLCSITQLFRLLGIVKIFPMLIPKPCSGDFKGRFWPKITLTSRNITLHQIAFILFHIKPITYHYYQVRCLSIILKRAFVTSCICWGKCFEIKLFYLFSVLEAINGTNKKQLSYLLNKRHPIILALDRKRTI